MIQNGKSAPPAFMKGIQQGEWQQITKPQLKSMQRPCYPLKTRVWANLMLHSAGYQSETAVRLHCGKLMSSTAADIAGELQKAATAYYREAQIDSGSDLSSSREKVRRALVDFEADGLIERQADHSIKVFQIPKMPAPQRIKKQFHAAKDTEDQIQFAFTQVFKALKIPLPQKSQSSDPSYQATVERAFEAARQQFLQVLADSKEPKFTNPSPFIAPIQRSTSAPLQRGPYKEKRKTEKKVEKREQPHPHPPASETTTSERMRMLVSEYPLTLKTLRSKDPAITEGFLERLVTTTTEHCKQDPTFPKNQLSQLTDKVFAAMVRESFRTGPKNHGIGLLLSRVPAIAITWSQDEPIRPSEQRSA